MTNLYSTEASHIDSRELDHRRLGHLGVDLIIFMLQKDCYTERGSKVREADFRKVYCKCDVCTLAKIKKFISHVSSERYSYWPGEFFYVDFTGPFAVSMQGNTYMVLFVDRATRLIVGIFVRNKNEDTAVEVMKRFIDTNLSAPRFTGKDFIFIQSDNGEVHSEKVMLYMGQWNISKI